jgi:hypothetical protein
LADWNNKARSHALGPFKPVVPSSEKFNVPLRYVCLRMSTPKMLGSLRAIRLLKMSDAEAPENVEAAFDVLRFFRMGCRLSCKVFD